MSTLVVMGDPDQYQTEGGVCTRRSGPSDLWR
jgi:hypothetical protein